MPDYEDLVVNDYLKPCPHCGFENPHARKYVGENDFPDKYAILCDYRDGGCGAESGHYHTLHEATLMWNKRTNDTPPKLVKVPIELTKHRVRMDLTEFVIHQLKPCTETDTSSVNYLDVANNISSYDDNWCNSNEEINIAPEIDSIVNQIMNKLFDKA